jgi:DNA-binding beta-propeller fold protein YncE
MGSARYLGAVVGVVLCALLGASAAGAATPVQPPGTTGCVALKGEGGCAVGRAIAGAERPAAVSPDGKNVYLVGQSNPEALEGDAIDIFDRDPTTGALTQKAGAAGCLAASGRDGCGKYQALHGAREAVVSPDGRNVYVTNGRGIVVFSRDATTGALTPLASPTECAVKNRLKAPCKSSQGLVGANSLAFSPDGSELYVSSLSYPTIAVLRRDPLTGALAATGCVAAAPGPRGCGGIPVGEGATDAIVASADGRSVYAVAVDIRDEDVITLVDAFARQANGALRRTGGKASCRRPNLGCVGRRGLRVIEDLALSFDGRFLYVTSTDSGGGGLLSTFDRNPKGSLSQPTERPTCLSAKGSECGGGEDTLGGAGGIATAPVGGAVYVTSTYGLAILIRGGSGELSGAPGSGSCLSDFKNFCTPAHGLEATSDVVVSPDGKNLYVTSFEPGGLAIFSR